MYKRLLLALTFFVSVYSVSAQQITENDLIGLWHIKAAEFDFFLFDFETDTLELSEMMSAGITSEEEMNELKNSVKEGTAELSTFKIQFNKGYTIKVFAEEDVLEEGTYSLIEKDNQYFIVTPDNKDEFPISIKDGILYWKMPSEGKENFTAHLKKVKP